MAKRHYMSTARRSRNRKQQSIPQSGNTAALESIGEPAPGWAPHSKPADVAQIISLERNRLMKAQAVLGCAVFALLYEDWLEAPDRPSFVDAVAAALDLVDEAVDQLQASFPDPGAKGDR
jgi:hypothetical protein